MTTTNYLINGACVCLLLPHFFDSTKAREGPRPPTRPVSLGSVLTSPRRPPLPSRPLSAAMTNLKTQKRLAASIMKCGKRKVWCVLRRLWRLARVLWGMRNGVRARRRGPRAACVTLPARGAVGGGAPLPAQLLWTRRALAAHPPAPAPRAGWTPRSRPRLRSRTLART